jgi:Bacterial regulatory proteins, gntR family
MELGSAKSEQKGSESSPKEGGLSEVGRDNLTARVYDELRRALMEGRFRPGHRFKIRELPSSLGVSETPVCESLMQLVRPVFLLSGIASLLGVLSTRLACVAD